MTSNTDDPIRADAPEPLGADFIIPVLACGLAIYYLATTTDLVWEARAAGVFVGVPLLAMCAFHFARTGYRIAQGKGTLGTGDLFANTPFNRQRLALAVLIALFVAAIPFIGTSLGLFLVLVASMWVLGVRRVRTLVLVAGVTSATVYLLLIQLVSSRLPQGPVEWLIGWIAASGAHLLGIGS